MKLLARAWSGFRAGDDALAPFRDRVATQLGALSAVLLLPFTVLHLLQGRLFLGAVIAVAQVVLALNARALRAGRPAPVPLVVMTAVFIGAVCGAIAIQGVHGVFWAYPALFICYFLLPRGQALLLSTVLVTGATLGALWAVSLPVAVRAGATLSLTLVMINVVLNVIGDLQRALVAQTITDPLTGAFNRRHLQTRLDQIAEQAASPTARPTVNTMLAIDIDQFKRINDRFGHAVGDRVLKDTVQVLLARTRRGDTLFRTGGEEFCLLLPDTTEAEALRLAEDLRLRVEAARLLPDERVTVSIGVGVQAPKQAPEEWLKQADKAMYSAKHSGRNRVVLAAV